MRKVLAVTVMLAAVAAARPASSEGAAPVDVTELAQIFNEVCIADFPAELAVAQYLSDKGATAMSPQEVARYLHADPGRGWYFKTATATYAVTLEDPPYHTCAVRRMTPEGDSGPGVRAFSDAVKAYETSIGGKDVSIKPTATQLPNGPQVLAFGSAVLDASGQPTDVFGVFLSDYHGQVNQPWQADAANGIGVEVRLTRRVMGR